MANRYLVALKYLVNSNSHLNFEFEGKIKFIPVTLLQTLQKETHYNIKIYNILRTYYDCKIIHLCGRVLFFIGSGWYSQTSYDNLTIVILVKLGFSCDSKLQAD